VVDMLGRVSALHTHRVGLDERRPQFSPFGVIATLGRGWPGSVRCGGALDLADALLALFDQSATGADALHLRPPLIYSARVIYIRRGAVL
jgi:hypothetical protein